jgi:hypothetical protein
MPSHRRRAHKGFDPATFAAASQGSEEGPDNSVIASMLEDDSQRASSEESILDLAAAPSTGPAVLPLDAQESPEVSVQEAPGSSLDQAASPSSGPGLLPIEAQQGLESLEGQETPQKTKELTALEKFKGVFAPSKSDMAAGKLRLGSMVGADSRDNRTGAASKGTDVGHLQNVSTVNSAAAGMYSPADALHNHAGERANWDSAPSEMSELAGGFKAGLGGISVGVDITKGVLAGLGGDSEGVQNAVGDGLGHTVDAVRGGFTAAGATAAAVSPLGIASSGISTLNEANKYRNAGGRRDIAHGAYEELSTREEMNDASGASSYASRDPSEADSSPLEQSEGLSTRLRDQYQTKAASQVVTTTKKQQNRAALNGTASALVTAGRVTTLATGATGAGAAAGAGLEVAGHGLKAGGGMLRGAKRMWRNRFGKKSNGELEQGRLVANEEDVAKNDSAKAQSAMVTVSTIQQMVTTDNAAGAELMRGLGFGTKAVKKYEAGHAPSAEAIYAKVRKR